MLDRMDIQVELPSVTYAEISSKDENAETSDDVRKRVNEARNYAKERYRKTGAQITDNSSMTTRDIREFCIMDEAAEKLLHSSFERLGLSARAHDKILRVARTIADLEQSEKIKFKHIAEAIQYRSLDRKYFNR